MAKKAQDNRHFILTVRAERSEELKKEIRSYGHTFKELEFLSSDVFKLYQVDFKNSSEKNSLCDYCDYLNGFTDSQ